MVVIRHSYSSNRHSMTTCSLLQANSLFTCLLTILYLKSVLAKMKTNSSFRYRTMVEINISSKVKEAKALQ
jgi:hypothetical protein